MSAKPISANVATVIIVVTFLGAISARAQDTSVPQLAAQLETQYKLTKVGPDGSITDPGAVLVIQKQGIVGVPPASVVLCPATYKDGALHPPGTMDRLVCGNDLRNLNAGEKVYVFKMDVNSKKDRVTLSIIECDSCNGATAASSYKSIVFFNFPKGYLAGADAGQIQDVIAQVFAIDAPPQDAPPETPQAPAAPGLTNDDIIKLLQAKLPDSVVIAKIKSSNCEFDTSTDGLIKLKKAGVSDAVLQAMVEAPPPSNPPDSADNTPAPANKENTPAPSCGDYSACMASGAAAFQAAQWAQALAKFQGASQVDPSKGDAWAGAGNAYFQLGQYDDAAGVWDKALQLGSILATNVCHAGAICSDKGSFNLSIKEVSFVNQKGEKEFSASPSEITSEGAVLFRGSTPAYYVQLRFGKNWRFYYLPVAVRCRMNFVCPEPGLTQQKAFGDYIHGTLVKMAAGNFAAAPK